MTVWGRILLAGLGSFALLAGALALQNLGGLEPCPLCIWQRWPHVIGVAIAVLGITVLAQYTRVLAALGAVTMTTGAGLAFYHTGIERGWWEGPDTCTSGDISGLSADALLNQIMEAPLVRCDEVAWEFLGLSMASWNGIVSLGLAGMWLASAVWDANPYDAER